MSVIHPELQALADGYVKNYRYPAHSHIIADWLADNDHPLADTYRWYLRHVIPATRVVQYPGELGQQPVFSEDQSRQARIAKYNQLLAVGGEPLAKLVYASMYRGFRPNGLISTLGIGSNPKEHEKFAQRNAVAKELSALGVLDPQYTGQVSGDKLAGVFSFFPTFASDMGNYRTSQHADNEYHRVIDHVLKSHADNLYKDQYGVHRAHPVERPDPAPEHIPTHYDSIPKHLQMGSVSQLRDKLQLARSSPLWVPKETPGREESTGYVPVDSSWISGVKYTPQRGSEMTVKKGGKNYSYPGLNLQMFKRWVKAKSPGKWWWRNIGYPMQGQPKQLSRSQDDPELQSLIQGFLENPEQHHRLGIIGDRLQELGHPSGELATWYAMHGLPSFINTGLVKGVNPSFNNGDYYTSNSMFRSASNEAAGFVHSVGGPQLSGLLLSAASRKYKSPDLYPSQEHHHYRQAALGELMSLGVIPKDDQHIAWSNPKSVASHVEALGDEHPSYTISHFPASAASFYKSHQDHFTQKSPRSFKTPPAQLSRWTGPVHPLFGNGVDGPLDVSPFSSLGHHEALNWLQDNISPHANFQHLAALTGWLPGATTSFRVSSGGWDSPNQLQAHTAGPNGSFAATRTISPPEEGVSTTPTVYNEALEIPKRPNNPFVGASGPTLLRQIRAAYELGIPQVKFNAVWAPSFRQMMAYSGGLHWPMMGANGHLPPGYLDTVPPAIVRHANMASKGQLLAAPDGFRTFENFFKSPMAVAHYRDNPISHDAFIDTTPGSYSRKAIERHVTEHATKHGQSPAIPDAQMAKTPLQFAQGTRYHPMTEHLLATGSLHPDYYDDYFEN